MPHRRRVRTLPPRVEASLPERTEDTLGAWWASQVGQYPPCGAPGIEYFKGYTEPGKWVDCLLYRDDTGTIIGILNHFTYDVPVLDTYAGQFLVLVKWQARRRGIGTALLSEAIKRWDLDLTKSDYTPAGAALVNAYLAAQRDTHNRPAAAPEEPA